METKIIVFDGDEGRNVTPVNFPIDYKPSKGQVIETMDGPYQVRGFRETTINGFVTSIYLSVVRIEHTR